MWTRKEVKERAKEALKRNYWKVVLVTVLFIFAGRGFGSAAAANRTAANTEDAEAIDMENDGAAGAIVMEIDGNADVIILKNEGDLSVSEETEVFISNMMDALEESLMEIVTELKQVSLAVWVAVAVVVIAFVFILAALVITIDILLLNPLYVGIQRFMLKSVDGTGNVSELGYTFDHHYKNGVKTTFYRDLYIILWSILFIIPGIYKKYQYYMVDYILAENPDMPYQAVLARSREMMDGHKWNTFVLDISFILWHMLSVVTCGILEIFYVIPYKQLTRASLYRTLQENIGNAADNAAGNVVDSEAGNAD